MITLCQIYVYAHSFENSLVTLELHWVSHRRPSHKLLASKLIHAFLDLPYVVRLAFFLKKVKFRNRFLICLSPVFHRRKDKRTQPRR